MEQKKKLTAALLCFFLGWFGVHRFYVGKTGTGILQILTLGGFGIWKFIDLLMILFDKFKDINGQDLYSLPIEHNAKQKKLVAAILCFFVGIFGVHRFYTGKIGTGILQILTLGGLDIWASVDLITILCDEFTNIQGQGLSYFGVKF